MTNKLSVEVADKSLLMVREVDAPRELVFQAYASCEAIKQWFGPQPWPVTHCEMDFRAGGQWHFKMTGPNGEEGWSLARYEEIQAPERIVYVDSFSDADRNIVPPESRVTVEFVDRGPKKTLLRMQSVYASNDARDQVIAMGVEQGVGISFDQLEAYLATQQ
ncbi:MAG: SRPBCC domain-containing protein [Dehalococcoidia bacterium]|nr:SRPBCC domain-containing protein [Dehalococcoidia bacterium]MCB9482829.1 SRPBCC domain-containing protein [Dehalococcoidia bacterium]MCB9492124.1 SRPBCC domain-containing protein [Dehalococcoidia bacterium]